MPKGVHGRVASDLRDFALGYPGAHEEFPWGERVVKVARKVFVFLGHPGDSLSLSVKLPESALLALDLPFTSPAGYGLGKSGWVTAQFGPRDKPPPELLRRWIDESYRAIAPRTMVARLGSQAAAGPETTRGPAGGRKVAAARGRPRASRVRPRQ